MSLDPVDPGQQLAHLIRVILDLLYLVEVTDAAGVGQDVLPLRTELLAQVMVLVVYQQAVLQIQRPGSGIEVVAGEQGPSSSTKIPLR